MMHQRKIVCKHCGSAEIAKDGELNYAVVQEKDTETDEPIGKPKTFFIFKCLSCGEGVYLEKFEMLAN
jgi:DNA-directed RNA polymerase subunit RPC12/RpoP